MASTYNYSLFFKGWAQCRLATDPDPDYEPRGVSGYTFALPGEPDMDRIINFQQRKGVVNRSFGPAVGVKVTGGYAFKTTGKEGNVTFEAKKEITKGHPLFGAKIDLLGDPKFSSHNSILVYNGYGIVNPFRLEVSTKNTKGKKVSVSRQFYIDPENPVEDLEKITIDQLSNYTIGIDVTSPPLITAGENSLKPKDRINTMGSPNMMYESGILDPVAYRQERLKNLQEELSNVRKKRPISRIKVAALEKRISELEINNPRNRRTIQLGAKVLLPYALNSKNALLNGKKIKAGPTWGVEMWMGGWDADSMCFY
ncbi:MAG: hypothetical protein P1U56_26670, partial [Saprospiraceae bacterium]|nr:hypothetical protein [Saprospiraceae bacterium]